VVRLVDDELGRRLLEHGDAGGALELLGGHRAAAPQDLLLVLAHDQKANAIGHYGGATAQRLREEDQHILRIGHLVVGQDNCKKSR